MGPVRVGNGADNQVQTTLWLSILGSTQSFFDTRLKRRAIPTFRPARALGAKRSSVSPLPDSGIWSFARGRRCTRFRHHVLAAADRLAKIAQALKLTECALLARGSRPHARGDLRACLQRQAAELCAPSAQEVDASLLVIHALSFLLRATHALSAP